MTVPSELISVPLRDVPQLAVTLVMLGLVAGGVTPPPPVPPELVEASINTGLAPEPTVPAVLTNSEAAPPDVADNTTFAPATCTLRVTVLLAPRTFTINAT